MQPHDAGRGEATCSPSDVGRGGSSMQPHGAGGRSSDASPHTAPMERGRPIVIGLLIVDGYNHSGALISLKI